MKNESIKNCTIIVLGASGDLAKRKLIPALYELKRRKMIENCLFVGAALEETSSEVILENSRAFMRKGDNHSWREFRERFIYESIDFVSLNGFKKLESAVSLHEKKYNVSGSRLLYLATPPSLFCAITQNAALSNLIIKQSLLANGWQRIVYEKPFGSDLASCKEINTCIKKYFDEDQIWRMDHYLSKELVSNISLLRFSNTMFEPLWFSKYVDHMQIVLDEKLLIADRGHYYDSYGAIKDVIQNHVIQLLALVAMDDPVSLTGEYLRDAKAAVIEKMIVEDGVLGQYKKYKDEKNVSSNSKTETFAALKFKIDTPRWQNVPFFVKTGKGLSKKSVAIHIFFKPVICKLEEVSRCLPNILTIRISPDSGFLLQLNVKKPNLEQVSPIDLSFSYDRKFEMESMSSYENLLLDIMRGYKSVGVRYDEIEAAWRVVDSIKKLNLPLYSYDVTSRGPKKADEFIQKYGRKWFYGHVSANE